MNAMHKQIRPPQDDAPHLLVVDDDQRIRELLSRYLADHSFRVTTASDAADARVKMGGIAFDMLVLDVMMPGETGIELAKSIRESSDVPILMLTARAETADRIAGLEVGVDDYLPKPFDPARTAASYQRYPAPLGATRGPRRRNGALRRF